MLVEEDLFIEQKKHLTHSLRGNRQQHQKETGNTEDERGHCLGVRMCCVCVHLRKV